MSSDGSGQALHRILVGMDVFGFADNALNAAISMAERTGAQLELVHAVPPHLRLVADEEPTDLEAARRAVEVAIESHVSGARLPEGFEAQHLTVAPSKHPAELVLRRAKEIDADLIVLGRHRKRSWLHPGNTVRGVLSSARCPVWVQAGPVRQVRRILVPVDLSDESLSALRTACAWGAALGASVLVMHCFVAPDLFVSGEEPIYGPSYVVDDLREQARREFEAAVAAHDFGGVPHETMFVEDDPVDRILSLQDEIDLVIMGTHGRTGLAGALLGNVTDAVIRNGHTPVVALRNPDREWLI